MAQRGTFSFVYSDPLIADYTLYAVDWDWIYKRQWACSIKDSEASAWDFVPGIDTRAYHVILTRCGLLDWKQEFPPERVQYMSPAQLAAARREKERLYHLTYLEIRSDTVGFRELAESVV